MSSHQNVSLSSLFSFRTVLSSLSVLISPITQTESQSKDLMLLLRYFVSQMLLVIPSGLLLLFLPKIWGIQGVWVGLTLVMGLRMVAGFARLGTATGPWRFLTQEKKNGNEKL
jgi:Na+-driven multidrug efflux pump